MSYLSQKGYRYVFLPRRANKAPIYNAGPCSQGYILAPLHANSAHL